MKKTTIVAVILLLTMSVFIGCSRSQKEKPKNGKPSNTSKTENIDYLKKVTIHYSSKIKPSEIEIKAMKENRAPTNVKMIVAKFPISEKAPKGKTVEALIMKKGGNQVLTSETFKSENLRDKQVHLKLHQNGTQFEQGEYILMIKESKGPDTIEKALVIGEVEKDKSRK